MALACIYQLSFTFKTRSVEKKAAEYAAQFPLDQQGEAEQHYLDSVQNLGVYNLGFKKFTYKECKEKELNLGLDLKGGMNVMLEVQVEDVVKALAGDSQNDPAFVGAIAEANAALKDGTSKRLYFRLREAPFSAFRTAVRWLRSSSAPTVRTSRSKAPMPTSRKFSRRKPMPPSPLRSTSCAAVSTISALRSPTSCACPTRTASWSSCRA